MKPPNDGDHYHYSPRVAEYNRDHWPTTNDDYVAFNFHNGWRHHHIGGKAFYDHNRNRRLATYEAAADDIYGPKEYTGVTPMEGQRL